VLSVCHQGNRQGVLPRGAMLSKVWLVARRGTARRFRDERDGKVSQGFPRIENSLNDMHVYEIRPRKDKRGVDLISDALPFGRLLVRRAERGRQCD
jgi:hypothetical protein